MKNLLAGISVFVLAMFLYSCGTSTYISNTWEKSGYSGKKFNKLLVLAIAKKNVSGERTLEDMVVKKLKESGINAVQSYTAIPRDLIDKNRDGKVDDNDAARDLLESKIQELGIDGAIIMALKDVSKEQYYVPGTTAWTPSYYYTPYHSYYFNSYNAVYSPGYYVNNTNVYFESSVFTAANRELVYAVQSETSNPANLSDFINSYATTLVNKLIEDRVVLR